MMPKTRKMKPQSSSTDAIAGIAPSSERTSTFIPGTRLIVRSGRSTRIARNAEIAERSLLSPESSRARTEATQPDTTTVKSSQFHTSRRYAPRLRTKPCATILSAISAVNT